MAGNYPDVPGPRMAYDRDGSIAFRIDSAANIYVLSESEMQYLNDETDGSPFQVHSYTAVYSGPWYIGIIFPELRDVVGYFFANGSGSDNPHAPLHIETSPDTTTGLDGTWTAIASLVNHNQAQTYYRDSIEALVASGVRGIRIKQDSANFDDWRVGSFHLYGSIHAGESPDRLRLWHPTADAEVGGAYFDWGNVPQGTNATRDFRVKNNSGSLMAHSIQLSLDSLYDTTPAVVTQHQLNYDGGAFDDTVVIGDLAHGAISLVCSVKRTTPNDAALGIWVARIMAQASSWS